MNLVLQINLFKLKLQKEICAEVPNAFWKKEKHVVGFFYQPHLKKKNRQILGI